MILGIGVDIIEIDRVQKACSSPAFLRRIFTEREIAAGEDRKNFFADNFAVKEAVSKCFGTGFRGFLPIDIEVLRDDLGKPYVNLYSGAVVVYEQLGAKQLHVSISNSKASSMAFAVLEG